MNSDERQFTAGALIGLCLILCAGGTEVEFLGKEELHWWDRKELLGKIRVPGNDAYIKIKKDANILRVTSNTGGVLFEQQNVLVVGCWSEEHRIVLYLERQVPGVAAYYFHALLVCIAIDDTMYSAVYLDEDARKLDHGRTFFLNGIYSFDFPEIIAQAGLKTPIGDNTSRLEHQRIRITIAGSEVGAGGAALSEESSSPELERHPPQGQPLERR